MNKLFGIALVAVAAAATPAQALVIASDISSTFSAADPTQLGRLSRDGVPSDWSTSKPFPGVINAGTSYRYQALTINFAPNATQDVYYQISIDDPAVAVFASAYGGSYNPAILSANYLGDVGSSGNQFGNPGFFQVKLAAGSGPFVLLINTVSVGSTPSYGYLVEAFSDTMYSEDFPAPTPSVPEPASWAMMLGGFALAGGAMRARRRMHLGIA